MGWGEGEHLECRLNESQPVLLGHVAHEGVEVALVGTDEQRERRARRNSYRARELGHAACARLINATRL